MNLLIVDDEPLIHRSLDYCLSQIEGPENAVFHAFNGDEMLRCMKEHVMDAVLVDVRMPGLSGLDAIRQARQVYPDTVYYVMSAYTEFEYAREAVRLGVADYVVKPLSVDDLRKILTEAELKKTERQQATRDRMRNMLAAVLHGTDTQSLYIPGFFTGLILMTYDGESLKTGWIPDFAEEHHDCLLSLPCEEGILLLVYSKDASPVNRIISRFPGNGYPADVTAFVSAVVNDAEALLKELEGLRAGAVTRILSGCGIRYDLQRLPVLSKEDTELADLLLTLKKAYEGKDYAAFTSLRYRAELKLSGIGKEGKRTAERRYASIARFFSNILAENIPGTEDALKNSLQQADARLLELSRSEDKLQQIVNYINGHYQEDLSISQLSDRFGLSPNYLSTILKQSLGTKFTAYLTGLRMAKAKQLLAAGELSIGEIAEAVGYHSQSHFNKLFAESEGCAPNEYKKKGA